MKKSYLLAGAVLLSAYSFGQQSENLLIEKNKSTAVVSRTIENSDRAPGDVIGSIMDFSDPMAWTIDNTDASPTGWVIGTDEPDGPFTTGSGVIASTSGGNFAMFQGDGNVGTATLTMASPIDLSTFANVAFEFESYYRQFTGSASIEFSTDGMTWTSIPVYDLLPVNETSDNPDFISINVTELIAGEATVWARFTYESTDDYFWMVDDVRFTEGFTNQLIMGQNYLSAGDGAWEYYTIPASQLTEYTFGARVNNNGTNDQTNTTLNVVINDGGSDIYDESSAPVTINAFGDDSLVLDMPTATLPGEGTYTISYEVSSADFTDELTADNVYTTEPITVGGRVYGRDNGINTGSIGFFGTTPVITVCGNNFEFFGDFNFGSVDVEIASTSGVGEMIYAEVRRWDGSDYVLEATSDDYTIAASDPGSVVRIQLEDLIECAEGDAFIVGVGHYGSETVRINTAQVASGAVVYNDGAGTTQNSVFMLSVVEDFVGIDEEAGVNGLGTYPNPATDLTNVTYRLLQESTVSLTITDLSGKVILVENYGSQSEGAYTQAINTENMSNGVYFYTLIVDGKEITNKLVISRN